MEKIFRIVTCGDVDSGKSTLFGRLLFNTGNIYKDQLEDIVRASGKYSAFDRIEYGYLFDGLMAERQQQITIDNAHRFFNIGNVRFHLIDCPGHRQYIRNFIVGCAEADCAVLVIDATKGIQEQTLRHYSYCKALGVGHVLFAVTKIDLVESRAVKELEAGICREFGTKEVLLTSAVENLRLEELERKLITLASAAAREKSWALFVQDNILTPGNRTVTGIETGVCDPSREVKVYPSAMPCRMSPGPCHTFLCDRNVDISRGSVITDAPVRVDSELSGHFVPFAEDMPSTLIFKIGTDAAYVKNLSSDRLVLRKAVAHAAIGDLKRLGYGILIDNTTKLTVGMFIVGDGGQRRYNGSRCYWFTGLSGAGKTTLARAFIDTFPIKPVLLDGDQVRSGANSDLTLSRADRDENVRRIAETAKLLVAQGHDVCVCSISKERAQRVAAREILGGSYVEIFVGSSDATRRRRDTKGFYRSGADVLDGYEQSDYPVITLSTDSATVAQSLRELTDKLKNNGTAS